MKKVFSMILLIGFILSGCSLQGPIPTAASNQKSTPANVQSSTNHEIRSVWLTYYELQELVSKKESTFRKNITEVFETISNMGFNTLTVQVRPCADAFYDSKYFPISNYCKARENDKLIYDPLKLICDLSKKYDIRIEAWINPYRVSQDANADKLNKNGKAYKWLQKESTKDRVYVMDNGIYFNPTSDAVEKLIVNGVREIVRNYDVCAIHFDDYFYPTQKKDIDRKNYEKYLSEGGKMKLSDYRRDRVNRLIKNVYNAVKNENNNVLFGISPAANMDSNYNNLYADVEKWMKEDGYIDYICPQIYFGFKNVYQPFMFTVKKWVSVCENTKLYVGLPLYKCGKADTYASEDDKSIINEFKNNRNIISRQITYLSKIDEIQGFYLFSYNNLVDKNNSAEIEAIKKVMQNSNQD